jgi:Domain of unknown function (DUF4442)
MNDDELRYAVVEAMPAHVLLGMELGHGDDRLAVFLPDRAQGRNHLGGQAGLTLFGVAEAASVAALFDRLGTGLDDVFAVPSGGDIRFRRPAVGGVVARGIMAADPAELLARVRVGKKVQLPITFRIEDGQGRLVADGEVVWHLGLQRPGSPRALPRRTG